MNNLDILVRFLDRQLKYADGMYDFPKVAFDQAFGGLQLFCELNPYFEQEAVDLWYEKYKPAFEKIVYGV
jgi:hypothetical protein